MSHKILARLLMLVSLGGVLLAGPAAAQPKPTPPPPETAPLPVDGGPIVTATPFAPGEDRFAEFRQQGKPGNRFGGRIFKDPQEDIPENLDWWTGERPRFINCNFDVSNDCIGVGDNRGRQYFWADDKRILLYLDNRQDLESNKIIRIEIFFVDRPRDPQPPRRWPVAEIPGIIPVYAKPGTVPDNRVLGFQYNYDPNRRLLQMQYRLQKQPQAEWIDLSRMVLRLGSGSNAPSQFLQREDIAALAWASHCPEPATWAMLILGFGLVGGRLRARQEQLPAAARPARDGDAA